MPDVFDRYAPARVYVDPSQEVQTGYIMPTGANPGWDAKLCQANSGTYAVTKQSKFGTSASWEVNRRSGVALAMRHRQTSPFLRPSDLRAHGLRKADELPSPAYGPLGVWHTLPSYFR